MPIDSVGTPGLGYPLLLCLGKGFVIILGYDQVAGPLWSGVLILLTTAPDLSHDWERSGNAACPGRGGRSSQIAGAPDLSWSPDPRGSPGPLMGSRTTCIVTGPLAKGKKSTPCLGVVRSRHVSTSTDTYTRPLGLHTKPHPPLHSLW